MWIQGIISALIAYLIGSIPTAFLVTRLRTGKDIRTIGSGNVGANNVWTNVGKISAVVVAVVDILKGIAAVILAQIIILNEVSMGKDIAVVDMLLFLMLAGIAAVVGHIWPFSLKFRGGNGIAPVLGVLLVLMTREVLIAIAITILIIAITRNPVLSVNIALFFTIPIAGGLMHAGMAWAYVTFALILIVIMVFNYIPTFKIALAEAGSREKLIAQLMRIEPEKPVKKKKKKK